MLVFGLNGSISIEHALGSKKARIHIGTRVQARIHRRQNAIVTCNDISQRLLNIAHLIKEDNANLDVQAVGLSLCLDLFEEGLGLVIDVLLRRGARLIKNEHNIRWLGLAFPRERKGNVCLQILVELGGRFLILLQRRCLARCGGISSKRGCYRHRHGNRQERTPPPHKGARQTSLYHIHCFHMSFLLS